MIARGLSICSIPPVEVDVVALLVLALLPLSTLERVLLSTGLREGGGSGLFGEELVPIQRGSRLTFFTGYINTTYPAV